MSAERHATAEPDTPRLSGALIITQRRVMEEIVGARVVTQALTRLPDEVRLEYETITPLTWFPAKWFNAVVTAVAAEVGRDVLPFHADVLRRSGERTVSTLWRIFLRCTTDQALVSRTPVFYSRSYTQGELTAAVKGPGRAEVSLRGWPHVPDIQVQAIELYIGTVLKLAGRKAVKVTAERRPTGAVFGVTWHPGLWTSFERTPSSRAL